MRVKEVAELLGVTEQTVRVGLQQGGSRSAQRSRQPRTGSITHMYSIRKK